MYAIGSKVVHLSRGAGTIIDIQQKCIGDTTRTYYVIDTIDKPMRLMVPVKLANSGRLRPVGKEDRLRKVLAARRMGFTEDDIPSDYRARKEIMSTKLKSGRFAEVASAVSGLFLLGCRRRLGMTDRRFLNNGKDFLAGELALASGLELSEAMEEIEEGLTQMLSA